MQAREEENQNVPIENRSVIELDTKTMQVIRQKGGIPTVGFAEFDFTINAFGQHAQAYGEVLNRNEIKVMPVNFPEQMRFRNQDIVKYVWVSNYDDQAAFNAHSTALSFNGGHAFELSDP